MRAASARPIRRPQPSSTSRSRAVPQRRAPPERRSEAARPSSRSCTRASVRATCLAAYEDRCAYVTVDAEPRREAVAGVGQDQVDRVGEVETRPELDLPVPDPGPTTPCAPTFHPAPL